MKPLFSIITVTFNAATTLPHTMKSVASQTFTDYEHLIVDGASTDATTDIAGSLATSATRITSEPDNGLYDAMNKGMSMANGEYLIFLNSGDTFHSPETLATIADAIHRNDFPGVVYGQTLIVDADRKPIGPRHLTAPENLSYKSFADGMVVCHQAFVVLSKLACDYDLRYRFSADFDWCIKCLQHSRKNVLIPEYLIDYLNEGVTTANHRASLLERFSIMAYYYGWPKAVMKHVSFIPRMVKSRLRSRKP